MAPMRKSKVAGVALAVVGCLLLAGAAYASGGEGGEHAIFTHEKLMDLLWRTLNFIALMVILVKYLSKPLANALSSRREAIANLFSDLNERRSEVEKTYNEYEAKLSHIDDEIQTILDNARAQAETEKEKIIAEANRAAEDIKRKAEIAVQNELANARKKLRCEIADLAAAKAEEIIRANLGADDQSRLVEEYLEKVGALS